MHSNLNAGIVNNAIRSVMTAIIDRPAFFLLKILYIVFISVAETELFNDSTIRHVYYKIQLILGIFMIFKLSVSVLEAIVNPDKLTAKKTGTMSIIARIFISLALLAALTPINIPNPKNDYEKKLKNNGLIFGVLYSLQSRILGQDTLGRLILGNELTVSSGKSDELKKQRNSYLTNAANSFTSTVLKTFMRINLVSEKDRVQNTTGEPDEANSQNWVCQNIDSNILDTYNDASSDPQEILDYINEDCSSGLKSKYVFAYLPLGGIAAYVFAFLLLTFTIDVAIRAIKIAILRLIAPIPVISYMSPNQKDNGAMGTWAKALMTTYLELFTRLLIVYIVIYLIQRIIFDGLTISASYSGLITPIAYIMIFLGLFLFARQAPKFIQDALGIKPGGGSVGIALASAGLGTLRGGGDARDVYDNMMGAARAAQSGGKDPVTGNSYRRNFGSYKDTRDAQIKQAKEKYNKSLANQYYERALDIDDQDLSNAGYKKKWYQSDKFKEAKENNEKLKVNNARYKANWNTHERSTGRGITARAGSEVHVRQDRYPTPTPSGQQGTPPSGPLSSSRGDAVDQSLGMERYNANGKKRGRPDMRPNGGSGYAASGSSPSGSTEVERIDVPPRDEPTPTPPALPPGGDPPPTLPPGGGAS